jgi:predicted patatin/cPLA2 family phospholipase
MTTSPSTPADAVRDLIRQRQSEGSQPGARRDGHRLALCIEGGAMRGVVSAGMVSALEQLDLLHVFDYVYGSSAGAMNGAFFIAGQAAVGTSIYYEDINNRQFISFSRVSRGKPILDLDFLVWEVMCKRKPLDAARVIDSPVRLRTLATDTTTGDRETFDAWRDPKDLLSCLRAGASMPIVAGPPYVFRGRTYWDALLSEPIPARAAEDDGCTHLVVLLTRPTGAEGPRLSPLDRYYILPRLRGVSHRIATRYGDRPRLYQELLKALGSGRGPSGRASVLTVSPIGSSIGKLERNADRLVAAARAGMRAVFDALGPNQ